MSSGSGDEVAGRLERYGHRELAVDCPAGRLVLTGGRDNGPPARFAKPGHPEDRRGRRGVAGQRRHRDRELLRRAIPPGLPEGDAAKVNSHEGGLRELTEIRTPRRARARFDNGGRSSPSSARTLPEPPPGGFRSSPARRRRPPLECLVAAADSASGVAIAVDPARATFVNEDLTIALHRGPVDQWMCRDAASGMTYACTYP